MEKKKIDWEKATVQALVSLAKENGWEKNKKLESDHTVYMIR